MTLKTLRASLLAAALASLALAACDPPAGPAAQRPPASPASAPSSTEPSPAPPGPAAAAPSAEPAPTKPPCPAGYTCDEAAWGREPRPVINEIFVQKGPHRLHLVSNGTIVRTYSVALGWGGMGPKKYEGDGVTPTGTYTITDRLDSKWHTFLGVSYPSLEDQRQFVQRRGRGEIPYGKGIGFGIAIHGHRKDQADGEHKKSDWTLGCIALDNAEIDEVASAVKRGTRVVITD